ncbi:MAG TPA: FG-GAP-like repeat-containing protein [Planctomycetaceae bacterium]|nr:FG-GAP-like repeat-containing protein [Planctomycetaceae bacterium]
MSVERLIGRCVAGLLLALVVAVIFWISLGKSADQFEAEGRAALGRRDLSLAEESFEQAVKASPDRLSAWKLLADAACRNGQIDRSYEALQVVARLAPDDANSLCLQLGGRWMANNRIQPAIRALQLATVASPQPPQPYRLLAQIYGVIGYRQEVTHCLVELLKRKEFTRNDLIVLSSINPSLDDPQRLELIMKADPADKSPLMPLAMQALDKNDIAGAKRYLSEITTADPENMEAQSSLGEIYADFQPDQFLDWHARLLPAAEKNARIWLARGKWLNSIDASASAVRCLHEAVVREPENLSAVTLLGQLLKSEGDLELGNAFTERGRRLQRIIDLNERMNDPRADEFVLPMIEELEAAGRLWEAWGWCVVYEQLMPRPNAMVHAARQRLEPQLRFELPRTNRMTLPGIDADWNRYPLPVWSQLNSRPTESSGIAPQNSSTIHFEDRSEYAQLDFRYVNTKSQEHGHKIYETMGAGVAVLDYDHDGWPDLYFPQGKPLPLDNVDGPSDALYRNQRGERYLTVTDSAEIHETTYSQGVAAGDFDNDGFTDIYVANLGRNTLYHNNGDGTFQDITDEAGIQQHVWTVSCAIADLNGDGLPELFDANYVQGHELLTATCYDQNHRSVVCRPTVFDPVLDTVCLNRGDGQFQELQDEAGLNLPQGMGLGLVIADYNDDDRLDVFIANDMTANFLMINDSGEPGESLRFHDEAFLRGVALDVNGLAQACMGVGCEDVNRDGRQDLFITNFARESNTLYLSQPSGLFQDETQQAGLREPSFDPLGFGTQFLDADRDGWSDLVVMNGHIDQFVDEPFQMKAQVFAGQTDGRFIELNGLQAGSLFDVLRLARGLARIDWNRDGRTDFVATDLEKPVLLAENTSENGNHSLRLKLVGTASNRDAIGAKVKALVSNGDERMCQLTAGDGYESSNERLIEIGVGAAESVVLVVVRWPSGTVSRFENVSCDRQWLAVEARTALVSDSHQ